MNALKLKIKRTLNKQFEEEAKRSAMEQARRYLEEHYEVEVANQRDNAMLHVMHVFVVLNKEFGFGAKRLERLYNAIVAENDTSNIKDGISWTVILSELDRIGIDIIDSSDRDYYERVAQRMYEQGVTHRGEDVIDVVAENNKRYQKRAD